VEYGAPMVVSQMDALHTSGLAIGHAGNGGRNGWRNATSTAMVSTIHGAKITD
jgi:hypothetical protein